MCTLTNPFALHRLTSVKLHGKHRPSSKLISQAHAESSDSYSKVMCSRVTKPKVAVLRRGPEHREAVIVDGSAFKVPGKTVTSEYFHMVVNNNLSCGFSRALQLEIFKSLRDVRPGDDPIYFVAVVQPDFVEPYYVYDIQGLKCYLACYRRDRFTFHRAIFGPELLEELRDVL